MTAIPVTPHIKIICRCGDPKCPWKAHSVAPPPPPDTDNWLGGPPDPWTGRVFWVAIALCVVMGGVASVLGAGACR